MHALPYDSRGKRTGQDVADFQITVARLGDDFGRNGRGRRRLVPFRQGAEVGANNFLVPTRGLFTGDDVVFGPIAGGVRGQNLVDENQLSIQPPEFKLGIGEDSSPRGCAGSGFSEQFE